jgi:hypothetical protein
MSNMEGESLDAVLARSAFYHGRTCRVDRHGRSVVHEQPAPWGEAAFSKLLGFVSQVEFRSFGRK